MSRAAAWLRRMGAVLSVLVLAAVALGPSLDGLVCRDETGLSAAAAERVVADIAADHDLPGHGKDGIGCVHGHCHHNSSYIATADATPAAVWRPEPRHNPLRTRVRTSDPQFDLMRPPRA